MGVDIIQQKFSYFYDWALTIQKFFEGIKNQIFPLPKLKVLCRDILTATKFYIVMLAVMKKPPVHMHSRGIPSFGFCSPHQLNFTRSIYFRFDIEILQGRPSFYF